METQTVWLFHKLNLIPAQQMNTVALLNMRCQNLGIAKIDESYHDPNFKSKIYKKNLVGWQDTKFCMIYIALAGQWHTTQSPHSVRDINCKCCEKEDDVWWLDEPCTWLHNFCISKIASQDPILCFTSSQRLIQVFLSGKSKWWSSGLSRTLCIGGRSIGLPIGLINSPSSSHLPCLHLHIYQLLESFCLFLVRWWYCGASGISWLLWQICKNRNIFFSLEVVC